MADPDNAASNLENLPLFADSGSPDIGEWGDGRTFGSERDGATDLRRSLQARLASAGSNGHGQPTATGPNGRHASGHADADDEPGLRARDITGHGDIGRGENIDWALVRAYREQAADQLAHALRDREGLDEAGRRELGRSIVVELLADHAEHALTKGLPIITQDEQIQLAEAIMAALFGLGRLQPLVDDPDIENIEINGHDNVHLIYDDGRIEEGPPVADSDEELIETLSFLASRTSSNERPFSPTNPRLHLRLRDGSRLAATAWITPRPVAVIRKHRLTDIGIRELVDLDMLSPAAAAFLAAAVRARKSIVVSGAQGAGKTTLVRALTNELDPLERIGTIETEYELHLHDMPDRHRRIVAWESRPGSGERGPDGRAVGEITLDDLVYDSLRMNLSRLIVGEVRGREVLPMFKAMQSGAGSLSTTHAHSARAAIERIVTCAMEAGQHVTESFAYRQIAEHIDLVVQIELRDESNAGGKRWRYLTEIVAVEPGEHGMPAVTDVFRPGPAGTAVPGTPPIWLADLERVGFDPRLLDQEG
ncbi:Flp pilus assembly CpaF family ATPase [Haloactinopolyspora alba]|uniref:Flp pilus assembly CpaF family ATPase n=1 Tax=Haloactinopolyspora alba TaxID=648780 RepID=A0A2P8DVW4_9ACTN|nr:ATPase, T2SS/T4P/T4SS family [Haloactinopolyspora alba]PSL01378.1 Flp pilus assembly CpaF family ATPase [Haloactinopolyspora alba]